MNTYTTAPSGAPSNLKQVGGNTDDGPSAATRDAPQEGGALDRAREMASDATAAVGTHVKGMLDQQIGKGCELIGTFAKSAKRAADDLHREAPQLAGLVRGAANRLEGVAKDMQDQSVDQLMKTASDYTRRQPALVFGLAAVAGFLALRTVRNASPGKSLPHGGGTRWADSHGN